jgi:hypothetical protein
MTYTYAILELSPAAYAEIRAKLEVAGYAHAFEKRDGVECIDMHGIAVQAEPAEQYRSYCFLSGHRTEPGWNPFAPTPLGALQEVNAWVTNPWIVTPESVVYHSHHYNMLTAMMRRALGWEKFGETPP